MGSVLSHLIYNICNTYIAICVIDHVNCCLGSSPTADETGNHIPHNFAPMIFIFVSTTLLVSEQSSRFSPTKTSSVFLPECMKIPWKWRQLSNSLLPVAIFCWLSCPRLHCNSINISINNINQPSSASLVPVHFLPYAD
jgi:hypothetical protein